MATVQMSKKASPPFRLDHLPPSVRKVFHILLEAGRLMRRGDIESQIQYSERMVRCTLRRLEREQLITQVRAL